VLVRDVADVSEGPALKRGEGSRNGRPAVIVGVLILLVLLLAWIDP